MSQHDHDIANQAGAASRADLNLALAAILSNNSGASAPTTTAAGMWWFDTTNNIMKVRNDGDSAWIQVFNVDDDLIPAAKTTTYTALLADHGKVIPCSASGGAFTVDLLAAATAGEGHIVTYIKTDSTVNKITIDGNGSETINGSTTITLDRQYNSVTLICDGSNWLLTNDDRITPYDIGFVAGYAADMTADDLVVQTYGELVMTRPGTITGESGYLETVATGAAVIVDIEKNSTTIYSTKPQFAVSTSTLTAGTLKTDGTEDFVAGDRITFKITQIGSTIAGARMRFSLTGEV